MQEMKPIKEGKVREIYDNGDSLIMVATDRISCFDVILNNQVTKKGTVLTQMSKFWFDMTQDILPNHMISVDVKDMPEFFQQEKFDGNSMMCRKLDRCCRSNVSSAATLQEAAGQATKRLVKSAASNYRKA